MLPLAKTSNNSYEDLINTNGSKRYYKVTFVDKDGLESQSQDKSVVGQTLSQDLAPVLNAPIINNNTVVLNWSTGANVAKFTVERSGGGSQKVVENILSSSYVDSDVIKGTRYTYQIYSVDEYGIGSIKSNKISVEF